MAAPAFRAAGAASSGLAAVTPGLPTGHTTNDILLCFVQTSNQNAGAVPTNATSGTWAEVLNSPKGAGTAAAAGAAGLRVYWMRDAGATIGTVTVPDSGDHTVAFICAYSGCVTSGNPWDVSNGATDTGTTTTANAAGSVPTRANDLIVFAIANAVDSTTAQFSSVASSGSLDSTPVDRTPASANTTSGTGGGLTVLDAAKNAPGTIGTPSFTMVGSSANYAEMTIALKTSAMTFSITGALSYIGSTARKTNRAVTAALSYRANFNFPWRATAALSYIGATAKQISRSLTAGDSSGTFIINENCEGTGTPAGWTDVNGTPNWDYSAAALAGSQSLYLSTAAAAHRTFIQFTNQTEIWAYFLFKFTNGSAPAGDRTLAGFAPNGSTTINPNLILTSALKLKFGVSTVAIPATGVVIDTTYHVWLHYMQGTGANAVYDVGFSTNGVRPTSGGTYAQITTGTFTGLSGRLYMGTTLATTNVDLIYDNIKVAATQIGDNGLVANPIFTGNLDNQTNKLLTAALSFVGAITKQVSRAITATLSFIGAIGTVLTSSAHNFTQALTAALSFAGASAHSTARQLTASLSFIGNFIYPWRQTAALSFVGTIAKRLSRSLSGALSFIGAIQKTLARALTGTLSFIGSFTRSVQKALTGTLSFIGAISKQTSRAIAATLSFLGNFIYPWRQSGSLSFIGSIIKRTSKNLTGSISFIGSVARSIQRSLTGTLSFLGSTSKQVARSLTATLSFIGSVAKTTQKLLVAATLSFIGSLATLLQLGSHAYTQALTATLSFAGSPSKALFLLRSLFTGTLSFTHPLSSERIAPDTIPEETNLTGSISLIQDDPDSPDANWLTATVASSDTIARVTFPTPVFRPYGTQTFKAWVRSTGTGSPTLSVSLYENGSLVSILASGIPVTSTTGQEISVDWDASLLGITDGSAVECRLVGSAG